LLCINLIDSARFVLSDNPQPKTLFYSLVFLQGKNQLHLPLTDLELAAQSLAGKNLPGKDDKFPGGTAALLAVGRPPAGDFYPEKTPLSFVGQIRLKIPSAEAKAESSPSIMWHFRL